jgi:hypothetical protein
LRPKRLRAGDVVELRPPAQILGTLDGEGRLDGMPFMPEMLAYYGRRHRVLARVERACDTIDGTSVRRIPETVILEDSRCDGSFHGGCQAACRIYWKEAWLQPVADAEPVASSSWTADHDALAARVSRVATADGAAPVFRCQATDMVGASEHVRRRDAPKSYARELLLRNVGVGRFVRVVTRAILEGLAMSLRLMSRGNLMPYVSPENRVQVDDPPTLQPGDLVRVRSKEEIARTLGRNGKNRGLWFDREMARYCGRTARVLSKVERIVDERTGKMIELKSDCYILEGVVCTAEHSRGRRLCPRGIYPYWRACWLEPISELATVGSTVTPREGKPTSPVAA